MDAFINHSFNRYFVAYFSGIGTWVCNITVYFILIFEIDSWYSF